jgi:predicted anti-sigma-YlaC factor YlaD
MKIRFFVVILTICGLILSSCSINKLAMNMVANALTGEGNSDVFTGDPDPRLVGDAIPFAIKLYESLLSANPSHQGLLLTTGSLFIMYANAFVQNPAEMLPTSEWRAREEGFKRAKQLYLRGYDILYDALDYRHRGFRQASLSNGTLQPILRRCTKDDVGFLYWAVAGGLSAYSIDVLDFRLSSYIPEWTAMIQRAYELDPNFGGASLDEFFVIFYAALPEMLGGDIEKAKFHFQLAQEKTRGRSVSAYVSYAQSISLPAQDYNTYRDYLERALAVNPDDDTSTRLVNIISQQKARWLLDNAWMFFSFLPMPDDY